MPADNGYQPDEPCQPEGDVVDDAVAVKKLVDVFKTMVDATSATAKIIEGSGDG